MWIPKSRTLVGSIRWQITGWILCSAQRGRHEPPAAGGGGGRAGIAFPFLLQRQVLQAHLTAPDPSQAHRRRNTLPPEKRVSQNSFLSFSICYKNTPRAVPVGSAWIPIWGAGGKAELDTMAVIKRLSHHVTGSKHSPSLPNNERLLVPAN